MYLWEALQVRKGEVVSFVGAGGKTTAMYCLGRELADQGWRVITTTTTMIRPPSPDQTRALIVNSDPVRAMHEADKALRRENLITLASQRLEAEDKLKGIEPHLVAALAKLADAVIIEADGARGRSLKAPAAYEPVVPFETTLLVPVVGIDAIGRRLTEETVHRPQLITELTGVARGEMIGASVLAELLVHEQGALKGAPAHSRVAPLINKVHDEVTLATARQVAGQIKGNDALVRVLIGAVANRPPIIECWRRVSAVVLAAGAAKRFGSPKQLLDVAGRTMIEHVLHSVKATSVDDVVVVLGHNAAEIAQCLPTWCRTVLNEDWETGISSSIRVGLKVVESNAEAALFILADQPCVGSEEIERILQGYYGSMKPIVVPVYQGQRGNPVLFDRRLFPALEETQGDVGGRQVMARFPEQVLAVEMRSPDMFLDIDTPTDYEELWRRDGGIEANG